jgi:hypothetical protein
MPQIIKITLAFIFNKALSSIKGHIMDVWTNLISKLLKN